MVKYSFLDKRIVYQSFYGVPLTFSYFLSKKSSVFWLLGLCSLYVEKNVVLRLCLLLEDGIAEASLPFSI